MTPKLAILLWAADPDHPHLCGAPFMHAAAACALDAEVEIHFSARSVLLLKQGIAETLFPGEKNELSVYQFMRLAHEHGAKLLACGAALSTHDLALADLVPEFGGIVGATSFVGRAIDPDWRVLTY
ncbi:MAG: peroxiredoxin [Gammaproteobacteria bacterium]